MLASRKQSGIPLSKKCIRIEQKEAKRTLNTPPKGTVSHKKRIPDETKP